jgi:dihydrofolate reductase
VALIFEHAHAVVGDKDVAIGGGADAVQQYLRAGLVEECVIQTHLTYRVGSRE